MFKFLVFAVILVIAAASPNPKPEPKPEAKPDIFAAAYTAPLIAAPALTYSSAYSLPLASYYAPSIYSSGYTAYSPYTASYVVV